MNNQVDTIRPVTATRVKATLAELGVALRPYENQLKIQVAVINGVPFRFDCTQAEQVITISAQVPQYALEPDRFQDALAWVTFVADQIDLVVPTVADFGEQHGVVLSVDGAIFTPVGLTDAQLKETIVSCVAVSLKIVDLFKEVFHGEKQTTS